MGNVAFRSKTDTWLMVVFLSSALICVGAALAVPALSQGGGWIVALLTLAVGVGLPAWIIASTHYTFVGTDLVVRCGPFRWHVPLGSISKVTTTRNPLSSPALSLDRLRIEYGDGRALMISPADRAGFLAVLEARTGSTVRLSGGDI